MCEIVMLIVGMIILIRGHFLWTRAKEVRGWPARIIGIILLMPFPLSVLVGMVLGAAFLAMGKNMEDPGFNSAAQIAGVAVVVLCFFAAIGVAMCFAEPIRKKRPERDDVAVPEDYDERFQARRGDIAESQDITGESSRPSVPPNDRIQS